MQFDGGSYLSPDELRTKLIRPAGVHGALAVVALGPRESKICCRSWSEAYRILTHCTGEVQRAIGVRCKPACSADGIALTRTQMARLAQSEAPPHPHTLRVGSPRASTTPPQEQTEVSPRRVRIASTATNSRSPRPTDY